jgi:hypothetical protein
MSGGPFSITESGEVDANPEWEAHVRRESYRIVEHDLRALGISIDLVIDSDGVSLAVWPQPSASERFAIRVSGVVPTLMSAVDAVREKVGT